MLGLELIVVLSGRARSAEPPWLRSMSKLRRMDGHLLVTHTFESLHQHTETTHTEKIGWASRARELANTRPTRDQGNVAHACVSMEGRRGWSGNASGSGARAKRPRRPYTRSASAAALVCQLRLRCQLRSCVRAWRAQRLTAPCRAVLRRVPELTSVAVERKPSG